MLRCIVLVLIGLPLCAVHAQTPTATPASASHRAIADTLIQLERAWGQAYIDRDAKTLDRLRSPDWYYVGPTGTITTRAQSDAEFASGTTTFVAFNIYDPHVRVYGNTAVLNAWERIILADADGNESTLLLRFTDVWVRQDGRWQAVITHSSLLDAAPR